MTGWRGQCQQYQCSSGFLDNSSSNGSAGSAINNTGGLGLTTFTSWWDASAPAQIGKGGNGDGPGTSGAANTGNGGGGANQNGQGGSGGSGIFIISYPF